MKTQHVIAVAILAISGSAFADQPNDPSRPLTRAEVRQSVLAARASGQLLLAGEATVYPAPEPSVPSTFTRREARAEVLQARAAGELIPAGERDDAFFARSQEDTHSDVTRAEVKAETLEARDEGKLIPAGNLVGSDLAREQAQTAYARSAWAAHHVHAVVAQND
jgi:Domain of unknown function (DUF4148)